MTNTPQPTAHALPWQGEAAREPRVVLRMGRVSFRYQNQPNYLLSDIDLTVKEGSLLTLVGKSGTGKTTLLNLLAGYLKPCEGTCYMDGFPILGPHPSRSPIFQEDSLWPWLRAIDNVTVHALLRQGPSAVPSCQAAACELMGRVGLPPDSYRRYPKELSVGMRKRVEIARALFAGPEVILADEPFASVDPDTREGLHHLTEKLWEAGRTTILLSTHDLDEALYLATEIAVLRRSGSSTKLAGVYDNPFRGKPQARREDSVSYFSFYDRIRDAMREACDD